MKPSEKWDGSKEFEFTILGFSDSDFAKEPTERKSVSGWAVFFEWGTYFDAKQNARLHDVVSDRSGISGSNGLYAGHVVFDAADGIDGIDGQETNGIDSGQQRGKGFSQLLERGWSKAAH